MCPVSHDFGLETYSDIGTPQQIYGSKKNPGASRLPAECPTAIREKRSMTLPSGTSSYQRLIHHAEHHAEVSQPEGSNIVTVKELLEDPHIQPGMMLSALSAVTSLFIPNKSTQTT